ncbi:MAG: hypothetical protein JO170_18225 [Verrucomicrobia bacterium]|nr:hypothetical protein [Verrucomicrobiota bacterium]
MSTLQFNGTKNDYVEIPSSADFSVATTGSLTVSAWMRPDVLTFPIAESTGYVHWLGKGEAGQQEWTFRMYNFKTQDQPSRRNRISFYVFNMPCLSGPRASIRSQRHSYYLDTTLHTLSIQVAS